MQYFKIIKYKNIKKIQVKLNKNKRELNKNKRKFNQNIHIKSISRQILKNVG
jgi:hypothetical protein